MIKDNEELSHPTYEHIRFYLGEELPEWKMRYIKNHLKRCDECRERYLTEEGSLKKF